MMLAKPSLVLPIAVLCMTALPCAHAGQADPEPQATAQASRSPEQVVKSTIDGVMAAIRSDPGARDGDPERTYQVVRKTFLQATDFSIYLTYVASGTTPGYTFGKRSYHCAPGSVMGWECRGSATLCKL